MKNAIKSLTNKIDREFGTSLNQALKNTQEVWFSSKYLNMIRRILSPLKVKLKYKLGMKYKKPLKLHLGCGNVRLSEYVNVDLRKTSITDLICDITKLPYPDNTVEVIENYHVIEHLPRHSLKKALDEWHRILLPDGKLIIECPDFDEIVKNYLRGDEKQLDGIFALQRFEGDFHQFGYNVERLSKALEKSGFIDILEKTPLDSHTAEWPCLRVECKKANNSFFYQQEEKKSCMIFSGERVVEGTTPDRIWNDHIARYLFSAGYIKGKTVLDIACGTGFGSELLNHKGAKNVIGIDISKASIDFANANYAEKGLCFLTGDILQIDFPDNHFDIAVSFETIEHIKDRKKALSELQRVLKPKGKLIISSPNRRLTSPGRSIGDPPDNLYHEIEFTSEEFKFFLSGRFNIVGLYGQGPIKKIFLIPLLEKMLRILHPQLFMPEARSYKVEKRRSFNEYRYNIAVCQNNKE